MSATYDLFARWKAHKRITSERAAMQELGLSPTAAQHWKEGRNGSLAVLERMANDLGEDYVPHVMRAFQETAPNEDERKAWRRLAKRLGAAGVILATLLPGAMPMPAQAAPESAETIHYAKPKPGRRRRTKNPGKPGIGDFPSFQPVAGPAPCRPFHRSRRLGDPALHRPRSTPQPLRPPRLCAGGYLPR